MLGFIMMGGSASLETQIHRALPEHVEMATTRVPFHNVSYKGLLEMVDRIPDAAKILAEARPSLIAVTSFTGSCIRGQEMVNVIQQTTGVPAIAPAPECVRILRRLGAKKIVMVTCFEHELRTLEQVFFSNHGIEILKFIEIEAPTGDDPFQLSRVDHQQVVDRLRREDLGAAEAVIVDIPILLFTGELQEELDRFLRVPVLNMARILLWSALERLGENTDGLYLKRFLQ